MLRQRQVHLLRSTAAERQLLGFVSRERSYLLGFTHALHADLVRQRLLRPDCRLTRGNPANVAGDVKESIRRMGGAPIQLTDLVIDPDAVVTFECGMTADVADAQMFAREEMSFGDFLLLPIERNIGIALANDIHDIHDLPDLQGGIRQASVSFRSQVIDPAYATCMFVKF